MGCEKMKDDPDIVKQLRLEEKQGKLQVISQQRIEDLHLPLTLSATLQNSAATCLYQDPQRTKGESELDNLEEQYQIIFENYAVGITLVDQKERIFSWNNYAEELFNMNEKDLFLRPVKTLYPPEEWKRIRNENVRQKGIKYKMETKMIRKNKGPFDVELSLCILRGGEGKTVGSIGIIRDISKLKKTEKKLKDSEERYRTIFENSAIAITMTDEKERIISWNKFTEDLLGLSKKDLHLKPVKDLYPEDEWKKIRAQNIRRKGMQHHLETKMYKKNNELLDVDISLSVLKNHEGKVIGSIGVVRNISERKIMERALEQSEKKFKLLYERAPVPYHTLTPTGTITDINEKWCQVLGYKKDEVVGRSIFTFIDQNEKNEARESFKDKIQSQKTYAGGHERTFITKNKTKRVFVIHDFLSFDRDKNVQSVHTTMEDITDRKQSEGELKQSEEKYRTIFELSPEAIVLIDKNGTLIDANSRVYDWLGYEPQEIIGTKITDLQFLPRVSKNKVKNKFSERMQGKNLPPYELDFLTKSGEKRIGMVYGNLIRDRNQKVIGDLVAISDITQRQRVWDEMVKSEEKYRVLAETSADGVFTTDTLGRLTYVNPSLEDLVGRRKGKILATPFREYLSESSVYLFQQAVMEARKKGHTIKNIELEIIHREGYEIPIEVNIAPLTKDEGFIGIECTVRDVSGRMRVVRELKLSEKLRTEFMNIVAHELKSPVTPIKGYLELIESDKDVSETIKNWARIGLRNAERLMRLVNDILDVSRLDTDTMRFNMEKINLIPILDDTAEDMETVIKNKNLRFIKEIPKELPEIIGDKYRVSQVLKNLLENAIKFTDFGSITLRAEEKENYLYITVEDTGIGFSNDESTKIFTKFYQAYTGDDRKNEGTGLGLFICKEIIKKHKGEIWAESQVGKGSVFTFKIPI